MTATPLDCVGIKFGFLIKIILKMKVFGHTGVVEIKAPLCNSESALFFCNLELGGCGGHGMKNTRKVMGLSFRQHRSQILNRFCIAFLF